MTIIQKVRKIPICIEHIFCAKRGSGSHTHEKKGHLGDRITSAQPGQLVPFQDADGSQGHILVLTRNL